jgi:hypothetical protein
VEVTVTGIASLQQLAATLERGQPSDLQETLQHFVEAFVQAAQRFSPFRSGKLAQSIRATITDGSVLIEATAPYAVYVLTGVSPQYMFWLQGKVVSFIGKDGQRVTRRVTFVGSKNGVRHWWNPGIPAKDFLRQAWEDRVVQVYVDELATLGVHLGIAFLYQPNYTG